MADPSELGESLDGGYLLGLSVLMNPVILDAIFSKMDIPTLKSARGVSTLWAYIGANALGKKSNVQLHKHLHLSSTSFQLPSIINQKLFQNLSICFEYIQKNESFGQQINEVKSSEVMKRNLTSVFSFLKNNLVDICLNLDRVQTDFLISAFPDIFSTTQFRMLSKIYIYVGRFLHSSTIPSLPNLLQLITLKDLELSFEHPTTFEEERGMRKFFPLFQALIYSSPNLQRLIIGCANFTPDLSKSAKLQTLWFEGVISVGKPLCTFTQIDTFNLKEVSRMLVDVKNSLIKLTLMHYGGQSGFPDYMAFCPQNYNSFSLPNMSKLSSLCLDPAYYALKNRLVPEDLPELKKLDLRFFKNDILKEEVVRSYAGLSDSTGRLFLGVEELQVDFITDHSIVSKMCSFFPNVKKLKFGLKCGRDRCDVLDESCSTKDLRECLDILCDWRYLTHSEIIVHIVVGISDFLTVLMSVGQLPGVRNLTIEFGILENLTDFFHCLSRIGSALSLYNPTDIIDFKRSWMSKEVVDEITKLGLDRNLQISISLLRQKPGLRGT